MSVSCNHSHSALRRAYATITRLHYTKLMASSMSSQTTSSVGVSPQTPESYCNLEVKEQLLIHTDESLFNEANRKMKSDVFLKDSLFKAYSLFAPQCTTLLITKSDISELTNLDSGNEEDSVFWCHTSTKEMSNTCQGGGEFGRKYMFPSALSAMFHVAVHQHYQLGGGELTNETIIFGFRYPKELVENVKVNVNAYSSSYNIHNLMIDHMSMIVGVIRMKGDLITEQMNTAKWMEEVTQQSISHYEAVFSCKVLEELQVASTVMCHNLCAVYSAVKPYMLDY
eukprot:3281547-Amphidinium_carterae.1